MDSTVSPTRVARLLSLVPFATTSASFSKNARSSKITMSKACPFGAHCLFTRTEAVPFYTIEESAKHSLRPFRDQCRCTGKARIPFSLILFFFNWLSVPSLLDQFMSAGVPESQWIRVYWIICKTKDQIPLN